MSRIRYTPEQIIGMLREAEIALDKPILKEALEGNYRGPPRRRRHGRGAGRNS